MSRVHAKNDMSPKRFRAFLILSIIVVILSTFSPAVNNDFANWDDETHLTEYIPIRALTFHNIRQIFTDSIHKTYIPLPTLTFAIEYHFFKLNPFIYHLDNILLHTASTVIIFLLGLRLGLPAFAAFIAAIIFGIHPTHVESVCWATERKGLLYSFFFLLAMHNYWSYITSHKRTPYALSMLCGILSILSKPMAISLPLIFFLLDWWHKRPFTKKLFLDKIPHLAYIIPIALITYLQHMRVPFKSLDEGVLVWIWTFLFYLKQFVFPLTIVPIYRLPQPVSLANMHYVFDICFFIAGLGALIRWRKNRMLIFSILFYLASIFFLLRMDKGHDLNLVADRYMYLPSLGFCFLGGIMAQRLLDQACKKSRRLWQLGYILLICLLVIFATKSYTQAYAWKNSLTLWSSVIAENPKEYIAYNNRGVIYAEKGEFDLALKNFDKAIELFPQYDEAYNNRGNLYRFQKKFSKAHLDFSRAILYNPKNANAYNNRAIMFSEQGSFGPALADFNKALAINPHFASAYYNRAYVFTELNLFDQAISDYNNAIAINPYDAPAYNNRGVLYYRMGIMDLAGADFDQALKLNPHEVSAQYNRLLVLGHSKKPPRPSAPQSGQGKEGIKNPKAKTLNFKSN